MKEFRQVIIHNEELDSRGDAIASVTHEHDCSPQEVEQVLSNYIEKIPQPKEPNIRIVPGSQTTRDIETESGEKFQQTDFQCELCSRDTIDK